MSAPKTILTGLLASSLAPALAFAADLTIYSAHGDDIYGPLVAAFEAKHPNIDVEVIVGETGPLYQRVQAEASNPAADVQWGGSIRSYEQFADLYATYASPETGALRISDPNNSWFPFTLFAQPLMVNTDKVAESDYPASVKDVLDPKWGDLGGVVLADPNHSGTGHTIVSGLASGLGWEFMTDVIKGVRATQGSTPMFEAVRDGEAALGWVNEDLGGKWMAEGLPVHMIYPPDGVTIQVDGLAIIKGAPNLEEAQAFVNFILSKDGQTVASEVVNRRSVRTDVTPPGGLPALGELKLYTEDEPRDVIKARFTQILEAN